MLAQSRRDPARESAASASSSPSTRGSGTSQRRGNAAAASEAGLEGGPAQGQGVGDWADWIAGAVGGEDAETGPATGVDTPKGSDAPSADYTDNPSGGSISIPEVTIVGNPPPPITCVPAAARPDGRREDTRIVAVAEEMALDFGKGSGTPESPASFSASAGEILRPAGGQKWGWVAPSLPGEVTLRGLTADGRESVLKVSVQGPESVVGTSASPKPSKYGGPGVSGLMALDVRPLTLPFAKVQLQEGIVGPSHLFGHYAEYEPGWHDENHGALADFAIGQGNRAGDEVQSPEVTRPIGPLGGAFTWAIPLSWRVRGTSTWNPLQTNNQTFRLMPDGFYSITKWGQTVSAPAPDPAAGSGV